MSSRKKGIKFSISLNGYGGELKNEFVNLIPKDNFKIIDFMPMREELKLAKIQPINLS